MSDELIAEIEAAINPQPATKQPSQMQIFYNLIGQGSAMQGVFRLMQEAAAWPRVNVAIQGETGTGKSSVAKTIHNISPQRASNFITCFCAGATVSSLSKEFMSAEDGTLFFDEVNDLPLETYSLLRTAIEDHRISVSTGRTMNVRTRLISSSTEDWEMLTLKSSLTANIFFSLCKILINLPPLRKRIEDIPLLAELFLKRLAAKYEKDVRAFSPDVMDAFCRYHWPQNVAELENVIERAIFLAKGQVIGIKDVPVQVISRSVPIKKSGQTSSDMPLKSQLEDPEKEIILCELRKRGGNIRDTAKTLNVSRTTLYTKLKKFRIQPDSLRE